MDQIRSRRSYPLCAFRDRASDSLLCSMLAWDPDRATGLRFASDTRPPLDARAPGLFNLRAQALEDYIDENEEDEGWDYEDKESFRVENLFPVDNGLLARRAAQDQHVQEHVMNAAMAELARRAREGQGNQSVDGVGFGPGAEDWAGAHAAGEDMLQDGEGDVAACEQRLRCEGLEDDDDDYGDDEMIDEDYAAEHNYRVY